MPRRAKLTNKAVQSFYQRVAENVTDPRPSSGRRHSLASVVRMVAATKLCAMRSSKACHDWIISQSNAMLGGMGWQEVNGVLQPPNVDRVKVIMQTLNPAELNKVINRAAAFEYAHPVAGLKGIAVDGKTRRHSTDAAGQQVHIVGAHWHDDHCLLATATTTLQAGTSATKRPTERGAFQPLIEQISDVKGTVITADALLTPKSGARHIFDRNGDYMLMAKDNQKTLADDLQLYVEEQKRQPPDF